MTKGAQKRISFVFWKLKHGVQLIKNEDNIQLFGDFEEVEFGTLGPS